MTNLLPVALSKQLLHHLIIYLALIALLALGLWLRLSFSHAVQLYPDEFVTLLAIQMIGEKGLPVMPSGLFYEHGLLFSYVGSLAVWFGPARLAVRYASLLSGLLTLGLLFWVGRRWFSPAVGLIALAGLVIAPTAINWSSRARMYSLLQLLILITLWLAYEGVIQNKAQWRWAALVTYLGATLAHFVAVALVPSLILALMILVLCSIRSLSRESLRPHDTLSSLLRLKKWKIWLEVAALLLILLIAFWVKRAGQPKGIETLEPAGVLPGLVQVWTIYSDLSLNLVDGWQAIAPFYLSLPAIIFTPFALVAITVNLTTNLAPFFRQRSFQRPAPPPPHLASPSSPHPVTSTLPGLFLSVLLLMTTLSMIFFVSPDRRDDKYLFMVLPVLLLLGAQGMGMVGRWWSGVRGQGSVVRGQGSGVGGQRLDAPPHSPISQSPNLPSSLLPILIVGLILALTWPKAQALLANTGDDYDAAFAYVQSHWQAGDTILTGTPAAAAFYLGRNDFYGVQRQGGYDYRLLTVAGRLVDRWLASPAIRTEADLHQTLAQHKVWLVLERWGLQREYYDLPFQQQLLAQTDYITEVQGIFILRSKPDPQPLALNPAQPVAATLGDLVRLSGYTVEPAKPTPGQSLRLTLYWQALAPLPADYTVFVHLRRPEGGIVAQADHRPLGSLSPTTLWPAGETIRESSKLDLPADLPPQTYELWTGLYLLETGERLAVQHDTSGENAVRLGELVIGK